MKRPRDFLRCSQWLFMLGILTALTLTAGGALADEAVLLPGHSSLHAEFTEDGKWLIYHNNLRGRETLQVWSLEEGRLLRTLRAPPDANFRLRPGNLFGSSASGDCGMVLDGELLIARAGDEELHPLPIEALNERMPHTCSITVDGSRLAIGCRGGRIVVYDLAEQRVVWNADTVPAFVPEAYERTLPLSGTNLVLASIGHGWMHYGEDHNIAYRLSDGTVDAQATELLGRRQDMRAIDVHSLGNGRIVLHWEQDECEGGIGIRIPNQVEIWDTSVWKQELSTPLGDLSASSAAIAEDRRRILVTAMVRDRTTSITESRLLALDYDGIHIASLRLPDDCRKMYLSPDGRWCLYEREYRLYLLDISDFGRGLPPRNSE